MMQNRDTYRENALLAYLVRTDSLMRTAAQTPAPQDSVTTDSTTQTVAAQKPRFMVAEASPEWKKFREEYIEWVRGIPMEARDTNAVYVKVRDLVNAGVFPASFVDEFNILETARAKDYVTAAKLVADFYEKYEIKNMDEFFLRNAVVIAFLAREPELANALYKDAIRRHEDMYAVEKLLIEKEIVRLRREQTRKNMGM